MPGKEGGLVGERRDINRKLLEKMEVEYGKYINDLLGKKPERIRKSVDEYLQELKDDMKRKEEELMINNNDISFEIVEHIGVISQNQHGWAKELNVVSWNGKRPKFDIRDWSPDHAHMSRGLTLSEHEMKILKDIVADKDLIIPAGSRDKKERDYER